jgi:hypothetical protein
MKSSEFSFGRAMEIRAPMDLSRMPNLIVSSFNALCRLGGIELLGSRSANSFSLDRSSTVS